MQDETRASDRDATDLDGRDQGRATLLATLVALCDLVYHRHLAEVQHPHGLDRSTVVSPAPAGDREVLTWEEYGQAARELAQTVADSGFVPDVVLGIARGGLIPAGSLAYALDCKNLFTISVEFYTGVDSRLDVPVMLPPFLNAHDLDEASVLVVDDVADTGRTLELVAKFCSGHVRDLQTAVLYEKPQSVITCDHVWKRTSRWINFPWSTEPPVTRRSGVLDA